MLRWIFAALLALTCLYVWKDRKNLEREEFLFVRRTGRGLWLLDLLAKIPLLRTIYTLAVPLCTLLMLTVFLMFLWNAAYVILTPTAKAGIAPILPGIRVPGSPVYVPFWYGMLGLLILIVVHEASHGIAARLEKIRTKSAGGLLFLVIPGAFVEMDEAQFARAKRLSRLRVAAAGSFANIVVALLALSLIVSFLGAASPRGVVLTEVINGTPAAAAFQRITVITEIDGTPVAKFEDVSRIANSTKPNQTLFFKTVFYENDTLFEETINLTTAVHPNSTSGFIGLLPTGLVRLKPSILFFTLPFQPVALIHFVSPEFWVADRWWVLFALKWIAFLNFAIGMVNLLPFFVMDGGVMLKDLLSYVAPKKAERIVGWVGNFIILLLLANLLPYFR